MNIKLQKLISLFNERKTFFNNHPDAYKFLHESFGQELPIGTKIELSVQKPGGEVEAVKFEVQEVDKKFVDSLSDILKK